MPKRKVLAVVGIIGVLLASIGLTMYFLSTRSSNGDKPTLSSTLQTVPVLSEPDDNFFSVVTSYVNSTENMTEKARGYKTLADAYTQAGKYDESLEAYYKAQSLEAQSDFSDEEKETIKNSILALEYKKEVNSKPPVSIEGGFKEPAQ
ncbi:MAG: tetratricopeptide repeat protein [Candidatus Saccharibacteria bacterium]|nr:tetratricopeptide repeat protein [Candidatus Saccharibacteria bacterium]